MTKLLKQLWNGEEGQGMTEYGLILALIALVVIGFMGTMGEEVASKFEEITNGLNGTTTP